MAKRKRLKLKEPFISIGRISGIILAIILAVFLFYRYEIHSIKRLGYSEKASNFILFNFIHKTNHIFHWKIPKKQITNKKPK